MSWVLDADVSEFFDAVDHEWLLKFVEHRVAGPGMLALIRKWLRAGVQEHDRYTTRGNYIPGTSGTFLDVPWIRHNGTDTKKNK